MMFLFYLCDSCGKQYLPARTATLLHSPQGWKVERARERKGSESARI